MVKFETNYVADRIDLNTVITPIVTARISIKIRIGPPVDFGIAFLKIECSKKIMVFTEFYSILQYFTGGEENNTSLPEFFGLKIF